MEPEIQSHVVAQVTAKTSAERLSLRDQGKLASRLLGIHSPLASMTKES